MNDCQNESLIGGVNIGSCRQQQKMHEFHFDVTVAFACNRYMDGLPFGVELKMEAGDALLLCEGLAHVFYEYNDIEISIGKMLKLLFIISYFNRN